MWPATRLLMPALQTQPACVEGHMDTTDTGIKILQLKVKKNQIIWFFWNFGTTQISPEVENLEMDPLRHRTIDLLIEHLQFLAAQQQEVASTMLRPLVRVL